MLQAALSSIYFLAYQHGMLLHLGSEASAQTCTSHSRCDGIIPAKYLSPCLGHRKSEELLSATIHQETWVSDGQNHGERSQQGLLTVKVLLLGLERLQEILCLLGRLSLCVSLKQLSEQAEQRC